jgi:hypothetical protein
MTFARVAAHAASDTWSGAVSNHWGAAGNWSDGVPTTTSTVTNNNAEKY